MSNLSDEKPNWIRLAPTQNENLPDLLTFARTNAGQHMDWFLRNREHGVRNLSALLAAEFTITSLYYSAAKISGWLAIASLFFLATLSPALGWLAILSCERAYTSFLENSLLVAKAIWAMGLATPVAVADELICATPCPVPDDKTPHVPRYLQDAMQDPTTDAYTQRN